MMTKCMLKKKKAMMDVKQQSEFLGVLTRSKSLALQKESRRFKKAGGGIVSGEVKKSVRGEGKSLLKGERRSLRKSKGEVVGEGLGLGLEGMVKRGEGVKGEDDLGSGDLVGGGLVAIGGGFDTVIGGGDALVAASRGGGGAMVAGGGGVFDEIGGAPLAIGGSNAALGFGYDGGIAENAGLDGGIAGNAGLVGGIGEKAGFGGGGIVAAAKGGAGSEGAGEGGGCILGDNVLVTGVNDRVTRESTPEHLIIRSDYTRTPCSSMKGTKAVADEKPQIEVEGNSTQRKKLTTDVLLEDNSNYAPSMEKYNFDFENEKPLPGRFEWEKIQP